MEVKPRALCFEFLTHFSKLKFGRSIKRHRNAIALAGQQKLTRRHKHTVQHYAMASTSSRWHETRSWAKETERKKGCESTNI